MKMRRWHVEFEVELPRGMRWETSGDTHPEKSVTSWEMGDETHFPSIWIPANADITEVMRDGYYLFPGMASLYRRVGGEWQIRSGGDWVESKRGDYVGAEWIGKLVKDV